MKHNDKHLKNFGNTVRRIRENKQWSQEKLAEHADLHRNYIGSIERGERNLALLNIIKIANCLDLTAAKLLELAEL